MYPPSGPQGPSLAFPDRPPVDPSDRYHEFVPPPLPPAGGSRAVQATLLVATLFTTTWAGGCHYVGFAHTFIELQNTAALTPAMFLQPSFYLYGLWYSLTILAILGCHEMGHYLMALHYRVDTTRPYFLPAPLMTGTLGAFIRLRSRIPNKIALFDIGIAGPIAGFVVAVPALFLGMAMSRIDPLPPDLSGMAYLGEPLLFKFAAWLVWGPRAEGYDLNLHPVAFAAWFGLLATALNLFPISQLDGGHIAYAVFGRRSTVITMLMVAIAIGLTFVSSSWIVWTIMMIVMIMVVGPHHPPTLDDDQELDKGRLLLAGFALVMLILCFTPAPIGPFVPGTS
ncbi:MAG TPA: site-2 protease family protein [Vicinamibacterales bacterium]|nr:site-2 protease family protein [Vicinamibacterales bacterium]